MSLNILSIFKKYLYLENVSIYFFLVIRYNFCWKKKCTWYSSISRNRQKIWRDLNNLGHDPVYIWTGKNDIACPRGSSLLAEWGLDSALRTHLYSTGFMSESLQEALNWASCLNWAYLVIVFPTVGPCQTLFQLRSVCPM